MTLMPEHIHDDDGTVEGCPGCFCEPEPAVVCSRTEPCPVHSPLHVPCPLREPATAPDLITRLLPAQVIVVGTNERGFHAGGAARYAYEHFGLRWGAGEGLSGQAYALPTMEGPVSLRAAVRRFTLYAELSHDLTFLLTKVGCGIAGHPESKVSALFAKAPVNVIRPAGWPPYDGTRHGKAGKVS